MRQSARGYTVVEVMSAMTLFAIGAAGVISMQRVTVQGSVDARSFDVASNIARQWQHRLQRDALTWTEPDSITASTNRDKTKWLKGTLDGTWKNPPVLAPTSGNGYAFDVLGHDVLQNDPERYYCVQLRLRWLADEANPLISVIGADIRVFWARLEHGLPDCDAAGADLDANRNKYQVIYVSTALRENPLQ